MKLPDHLLVQFLIWQIRKLRTVKQWNCLHACMCSVASAAATAKSLRLIRPIRRQPTRLLFPWDSPGKNPGVGCHFLLQYMHACMLSRFSHVQLCDPMDGSPPGSSVHGILQTRILDGLPCLPPGDLPALLADSSPLSHGGSPSEAIYSRSICQEGVGEWRPQTRFCLELFPLHSYGTSRYSHGYFLDFNGSQ